MVRGPSVAAGLVVMALGAFAPAASARAQSRSVVAGAVVEPSTGLPIPNVEVRVLGTNRLTRSDSLGGFTLALDAGRYLVRATRLGFGPRSIPIELAAGDTMTIAIDFMHHKNSPIAEGQACDCPPECQTVGRR